MNIYDDKLAQFNLAELNYTHDEPSMNGLNIGYKPMTRTSLSPRYTFREYYNIVFTCLNNLLDPQIFFIRRRDCIDE